MPAQPMHSYSVLPVQMVYAAQPYPQTAALTPSSNSSASSGGNTPRHAGHRKGALKTSVDNTYWSIIILMLRNSWWYWNDGWSSSKI